MARETLSKDRIIGAALAVADAGGLEGLTIRSLATRLGTSPMAIYHYVANKDEILDGLVDLVFAEVDLPVAGQPWRGEIGRQMGSMREVLRRHPWAIGLVESRTSPGPATLAHHEAMLATLRQGGFSLVAAAHAYALVDSYVYGFAVQETSLPIGEPEDAGALAGEIMAAFESGAYPYMVEIATEHVMLPRYDFGAEFDFGCAFVLDGLERMLEKA